MTFMEEFQCGDCSHSLCEDEEGVPYIDEDPNALKCKKENPVVAVSVCMDRLGTGQVQDPCRYQAGLDGQCFRLKILSTFHV